MKAALLIFCAASFLLPLHANPKPTMNAIANDTRVFRIDPAISAKDVRFSNRFGIELAGHLYLPKDFDATKKYAAIAVCGPFGAVKEQASGLYAQELASRGLVAVAFDPSYTGESSGTPRYVNSPDINTEDFCAAVDFLSLLPFVDAEKVGIVGICGWGGMALNAAAIDPRIRATVASTMYDMHCVTANGYFDSADSAEARDAMRKDLAAQRLKDAQLPAPETAGGVPDALPEDAPQFVKDYFAYYKTKRGEKAHSRYFSETAFSKLKGENKELLIVPGASHTDLYDNFDKIPFDKIDSFFRLYLR